ncbi:MFS family permease [Agrobacterium vitis]|nr:MFS family permease [Agrobacterium vitis]MBE1439904.1 MFS family permease [Agrobacterium vitis]
MAVTSAPGTRAQSTAGLLDRERIIAQPGFNRWLVPPAALAIHLCIGMAYGFSVFWLPLSKAIGTTAPASCASMTLLDALTTTTCNWRVADLGWIYTLFFVLLGCSAALWGGWLERVGPRRAGFVSACCWCGGIVVAAIGVMTHQLWLMWLGAGVIGGIGLGLGYISPVSTLIKWFPDRRGMATGMAIMGFGGGAMIGAPLANILMTTFRVDGSVGVWQTFLVMAAVYFVFMMGGAFSYRIPPAGWRPEGWTPPVAKSSMITTRHVHLRDAHKTPQFWLIWAVLCLNVSAGIGVIGVASPMLQEIFAGSLIGLPDLTFSQLDAGQKAQIAAIAAGFTGLLSLFNIGGRFFWASISDRLGRKNTYYCFFLLGIVLYALAPTLAGLGSKAMFVLAFGVILSMYGGGFATVPAYLADIFGTQFVGAIHGRLLTAWATAGILGPTVVNYIREAQISAGVSPGPALYSGTMYILSGMLVIGLLANALIKPLPDKWFMSDDEVAALQAKSAAVSAGPTGSFGIGKGGLDAKAAVAWAVVGLPLLWGVWVTLKSSLILFG